MPESAAPVAEPTTEQAGDSGQQHPVEAGFDFEAAFAGSAGASKPVESVVEPVAAAAAGDSGQPEAEAAPADAAVASKPADTTEPASPRRGKGIEAERQSWAEREAELRTNWETEQRERQGAQQALAEREAEQQRLLQSVAAEVGPQAEFERLNALPSSVLSFEQQEQLDGWKAARSTLAPRIEFAQHVAQTNLRTGLQAEATRLAELPGISPEAIQTTGAGAAAPFEALCRYFYDTATALKDAEYREQIASLEAEVADLRTKRAGQARPLETGGSSPGVQPAPNPNAWDPNRSATENFDLAFVPATRRRAS